MKNKKKLIIGIISILIIAIIILYFVNKKNNISFFLNGEENMVIEYGKEFSDPGFVAKDGYGNNISTYVKVNSDVDVFSAGAYKISYNLDYNNIKKELVRIVMVKDIDIKDLKIELNGDETVYVIKDSTYTEEGANVVNIINNSKFENGELNTSGEVDTAKTGTYEINYELNYKGQVINQVRKVIVFDIGYTLTPEELTPNKVKITLDLDNIENYSHTKLPDDYTVLNKNVEYEVSSNGVYTFTIVLNNKKEYKKDIVIDNIIGKYTCSGEITSTGTKISVSPATSEIKEYEWNINGEIVKGSNIYQKNKIVNNAKVNLVLSSGKKYELTCNITDKLVYHFKYDANNTKPYMKCDTYTAADKTKYDAILKSAIEEAGYGTRAGVVEAARFLVGGLDYKVRYLGPKKVNSALGRYKKVGLNIGQNGAWGCNVSGWTQGMDCTNFVAWAFYQNGINMEPYSSRQYKVSDAIDKLRAGDLLYAPCTSADCKNIYKLTHVGIIIGVDDNNIYVAESTTGNINAIVTTKFTKQELLNSNFKLYNPYNYSSDGNYTSMWMSE